MKHQLTTSALPMDIDFLLTKTAIYYVLDTRDGHRGFRNVGSKDHFPGPSRNRFKNFHLFSGWKRRVYWPNKDLWSMRQAQK